MCPHAITVISSLFLLGLVIAAAMAYNHRDGHAPDNNEICLMFLAVIFINLPYLLQN
nr:hypothetical protein K-LCC10_0344 [Kaumoebavirus]